MSTSKTTRRVAFIAPGRAEYVYGGLRGLLDFKEQHKWWRILGHNQEPFAAFPELDLSAVDGVIGYFHDLSWADTVRAAGVPTVNLSNRFRDIDLPRVSNDDEAIGRIAAEHLLERGFVHYAFFSMTNDWFAERRRAGFRALVEQKTGRECHVFTRPPGPPPAARTIMAWLTQLPKPVGILAAIDLYGRTLIKLALELGLSVPRDVAVMGVNNERWMVHMESVSMSSIELNERRVGYQGAVLLEKLMSGEPAPKEEMWIPPIGAVTRGSTDIVVADDPVVAAALKFINDRCGEGIGVEDILDELTVSRRSFELRLKRAMGLTPKMAIFRAQIEKAKKLIVETPAPLHQIAAKCGFEHEPRFFLVFKRMTGMTPGDFRRKYRVPTI